MTTKESAIRTIASLPDDVTWDDIRERIDFIAGVRKGIQQLDEDKGIPHQRVKEDFAPWISA